MAKDWNLGMARTDGISSRELRRLKYGSYFIPSHYAWIYAKIFSALKSYILAMFHLFLNLIGACPVSDMLLFE